LPASRRQATACAHHGGRGGHDVLARAGSGAGDEHKKGERVKEEGENGHKEGERKKKIQVEKKRRGGEFYDK